MSRGMSAGGGDGSGGEILRLRKELVHAKTQITDLQEELQEKTTLYIQAINDRDQYREKLNNAKESISKVEVIVESKVKMALEKERMQLAKLREDNDLLQKQVAMLDSDKLQMYQREKQLQDKINGLTQDLQFYARNADTRDQIQRIEKLREERDVKELKITENLETMNAMQRQLEDLAAENRTLRKMAQVPDNYGIDLATIKLNADKKIENYTKLIKVLQDDNYKLEEERARLKHMLKQQSMMYGNNTPWDRHPDLNPEQLFKVDQYVIRLKSGETEEPSDFYKLKKENTTLKAQLEALSSKNEETAKNLLNSILKELGLKGDSSEGSAKLFEKLQSGNEEVKKQINKLFDYIGSLPAGGSGGGNSSNYQPDVHISGGGIVNHYTGGSGRFRPPVPNVDVDNDIRSGRSIVFRTELEVADKDGKLGLAANEQTRYDVAFLQLQLQEIMELVKRKDEELSTKNSEIDQLYKRIREYLMVQDQLYKDFVKSEKTATKTKEEMEGKFKDINDLYRSERSKVESLEALVSQLKSGVSAQSVQARLIELTKQNSLLDINLVKLTRKYQTLAEQEDLLRRDYHSREADLADKDVHVQARINELKKWKAKAIQQIKFLFTKLRLAVPLTEYQGIQTENDLLKQRNADYIDRNSRLAERVARLQTQVRENLEAEEKLRQMQEQRDDLENEYEVVRKRLEHCDPQFKWENGIFTKIVTVLKRYRVSPQQAFEEFDSNQDGKLSREEFIRALDKLKIVDLSNQEIDMLMASCDYDADGQIKYKEFARKLSRHGVKSRTAEEQILYLMIEAFKRTGVSSLSKAFTLFDRLDRGSISRDDFKEVFTSMKLRIDESEIDKFIDHFWRDQKAGIDYQAFLRIFQRYQLRLDEDEKSAKRGGGVVMRIPDDVIRLKKRIFDEISIQLKKAGKTIDSFFRKADKDGSQEIDLDEFKLLFKNMQIPLTESELSQIFSCIDFDMSGKVTFPEFISDMKQTVETNTETLIKREKERYESAMHRSQYNSRQDDMSSTQQFNSAMPINQAKNQEIQLQTRVAILETREKQLNRKLETAMTIVNHSNQSQLTISKQYDELEKRWSELTEMFHNDKQVIRELEEKIRQSIPKDQGKKLQEDNERLQTELVETRAAMLAFKSMNEVVSDQVKGLKLIIDRRKDEYANLQHALTELSGQSDEQKRLGKLYYLIMLSRWQEAALSRKYDTLLNENRELRAELLNTEQLLQNAQFLHGQAENTLQEQVVAAEKLRMKIGDNKNVFLTIEKAEEFNQRINFLSDEKSILEDEYFKMRSKYRSNQLIMDEAVAKSENYQELLDTLQRSKQSELSDRLISLSEKLQSMRLGEMRATRELKEVKEKNDYFARLLRTSTETVKNLEERVAEFESRMNKREEEFRRADNERMKRFFNARYDDLQPIQRAQSADPPNPFMNNASRPSTAQPQIIEQRTITRYQQPAASFEPSQTTSSMVRQHSDNVGAGQDAKYYEGKIRKIKEELDKAIEDNRQKDGIIKKFRQWQLADKYLSEDQVLNDAIQSQQNTYNQAHEQETKEMAEAAAQMVKTMQELLDQKNEQLRNKEHQLEDARKMMQIQSEKDGLEIAKLRQQMSLAAGSTLADLQKIVIANQHSQQSASQPTTIHGLKYEKLTREELSRSLDEKDSAIRHHEQTISNQEVHLQHLKHKNEELQDRVNDLGAQLEVERQQNELKAKIKELERVRKELQEKDRKSEKLMKTIKELGDKMQEYEIKNSGQSEQSKMHAIMMDQAKKAHDEQLKKTNDKLTIATNGTKQAKEDLKQANIKVQSLTEELASQKQLIADSKAKVHQAEENLLQEKRITQKLHLQNEALQRSVNSVHNASQGGLTYEQLQVRCKELENDTIILRCQLKTVVLYNKENGTFEYISQPISLKGKAENGEISDMEEFIAEVKKWLARPENQSLTVRSIFEGLDIQNFGTLLEKDMHTAFNKIGIELRPKEKRMLKDVLDPLNINRLKYRELLREIQGIPQMEFISTELLKLAKQLVEGRDLTVQAFQKLIDPKGTEMMSLTQLQESIQQVKNDNFNMSNEEVEILFKHVAKCQRTLGVNISITKLAERVFTAFDALLIAKMRDSIAKQMKPFADLVVQFDSNKDGFLDKKEIEQLFLSCSLAFNENALNRVFNHIFDLSRSQKPQTKVSSQTLKFFLSPDTSSASVSHQSRANYDMHPQRGDNNKAKPSGNQDQVVMSMREDDATPEEIAICRTGARKILQSFSSTLVDALESKDRFKEGLISRDDVSKIVEEQKIGDLQPVEVSLLLKLADRGSKGYIVIDKFIERLQELSNETKQETVLKTFALACKRQTINLKRDLMKFDTKRENRLDKRTFFNALNQLPIQVSDQELLFQAGESQEFRGMVDIQLFIDRVSQASKYSPLASVVQQQKQIKKGGNGGGSQQQQPGFESWEIEKKYKTKLVALQQQIEESKKETQAAEKQAHHWQETASRLEKEKNAIQARLVDFNAKPPKAQAVESNGQAQIELIQQLKDQIFHLQEERTKLEKTVAVELRSEMKRRLFEQEKIQDKNKHLQEDVRRLQEQIERILRRAEPLNATEKREELEFYRERRIQELENELLERDRTEQGLNEQLFKADEKILDLKFEKETFDLQFARLQKRNTDLEQYKLASAKYSSVLKNQESAQREALADTAGVTAATLLGIGAEQKKEDRDTVRLKSKSTKSVAELEQLVESLKRVIEKQKTETDALKKTIDAQEQRGEKLKSEKQLRQRIESLEQELHAYEMKDVNLDEKDRTLKRLIQANHKLQEDLDKELERFALLEQKHKDLLYKFNALAKENAKYAQMLFTQSTGGKLDNFDAFLGAANERPTTQATTNDYFAKQFERSL